MQTMKRDLKNVYRAFEHDQSDCFFSGASTIFCRDPAPVGTTLAMGLPSWLKALAVNRAGHLAIWDYACLTGAVKWDELPCKGPRSMQKSSLKRHLLGTSSTGYNESDWPPRNVSLQFLQLFWLKIGESDT